MEVDPGVKVMRRGEIGDRACFILAGKAVAGVAGEEGQYHSLATMAAGDFFGEIAALTGAARTADVAVEESIQLLEVPGPVLRGMMAQPVFSQLVLGRMRERLARTTIRDLPRLTGVNPQDARELQVAMAPA